ncbi:hypothetical protein DFJ74DRAFT_657199 [Hyaloraphidium curvatum]|nr:hypothetical protein DFJ74DRAFT_657199 [Hyaloraphidium curvatum]
MLHALRPASIGDTLTRAGRARRMSSAAAGAPRDEKGRVVQVAAPLAVRPFWQASYLSHVLVTLLRTLMDAAGLALNWVALYSLPEGVTLATAYGALCVIGSVLFVAHAATLWAAAMASRREDVDISRATLRGKERVMRHTLAFLKAELRRVKLACVREGVSRTSMVGRRPFRRTRSTR